MTEINDILMLSEFFKISKCTKFVRKKFPPFLTRIQWYTEAVRVFQNMQMDKIRTKKHFPFFWHGFNEVVNLLWLFESVKIKVSNHVAEMARRKRRTFLEASGEPQRLCRGCHRTSKSSGGFWRPLRLLEAFIKAPPFPPRHSRQMNWHFDFDSFKES